MILTKLTVIFVDITAKQAETSIQLQKMVLQPIRLNLNHGSQYTERIVRIFVL